MEEASKRSLILRKNEARSLLKKCFKNPLFSLVPFEIWRDLIVSNAELKTITFLSQTCFAFKDLVDNIGANNFNLALMLRREGQIDLARKCLFKCAENNNSFAMLHLGYAHYDGHGGWALETNHKKACEWLKKSAELENGHAMALLARCFSSGSGVECDAKLRYDWGKKALSSCNSFAVGYCYFSALGTEASLEKAFSSFEASAKEGDEFGQDFVGYCFRCGQGCNKDNQKAFYWTLKSAEQGHCKAQFYLAKMYDDGRGCEKDEQKACIWLKKSAKQGSASSKKALRKMENEGKFF